MNRIALLALVTLPLASCAPAAPPPAAPAPSAYLDNTGRDDVLTGGVKMIPITTPKGTFKVRIVVLTTEGTTLRGTRTYRTCTRR